MPLTFEERSILAKYSCSTRVLVPHTRSLCVILCAISCVCTYMVYVYACMCVYVQYMSVNCVYLVMVKYIVFITLYSEEEFKWTLDDIVSPSEATVSQRSEIQPFTAHSTGPTERTKEATTPLETFRLLLPDSILESIVYQTLLFAEQKEVNLQFCVAELKAFLVVNVAMGLLKLPRVGDYWSRNEVLATPWFSSILPRDRFLRILRYLHLNDSSKQKKYGEVGYDQLFKVRPLLDHLSAVFPT